MSWLATRAAGQREVRVCWIVWDRISGIAAEAVTLTVASWNRIGEWLECLEALRQPR
jgi:hypothetical protein